MAAPTFTAANLSADWDRGAVINNYIANVALVIGNVVYIDSNNKANKALADTEAHSRAIGIVVGSPNYYGETNIVAGDYAAVCILGPVSGFSGLASGVPYWVDRTTAGAMTDSAPSSAWRVVVGHAIGADTIFVNPGTASPVSA